MRTVVCCALLLACAVCASAQSPKNELAQKQALAQANAKAIDSAVLLFQFDVGRYPTNKEGLGALMVQPKGAKRWRGPYLKKLAVDPWNHPYHYCLTGHTYTVTSYGSDNKPGGRGEAADIKGN